MMWALGDYCPYRAGKRRAAGPARTTPYYTKYQPRHRVCPECGR